MQNLCFCTTVTQKVYKHSAHQIMQVILVAIRSFSDFISLKWSKRNTKELLCYSLHSAVFFFFLMMSRCLCTNKTNISATTDGQF